MDTLPLTRAEFAELEIENSHLNTAYLDCKDKLQEIDLFFKFLNTIENGKNLHLQGVDKESNIGFNLLMPSSLIETIRASGFLLLYNLLEATLSKTIGAIYKTIQNAEAFHNLQNNQPDLFVFQLNANLQKAMLKQYSSIFSVDGIKEICKTKTNFINNITSKGYSERSLFSGNIDCDKINDLTKSVFNFSVRPISNFPYDTRHILAIKNKRNTLAHGAQTFNEISANLAIGELLNHYNSTIKLINGVFSSINTYLEEKRYLDQPPITEIVETTAQ